MGQNTYRVSGEVNHVHSHPSKELNSTCSPQQSDSANCTVRNELHGLYSALGRMCLGTYGTAHKSWVSPEMV